MSTIRHFGHKRKQNNVAYHSRDVKRNQNIRMYLTNCAYSTTILYVVFDK